MILQERTFIGLDLTKYPKLQQYEQLYVSHGNRFLGSAGFKTMTDADTGVLIELAMKKELNQIPLNWFICGAKQIQYVIEAGMTKEEWELFAPWAHMNESYHFAMNLLAVYGLDKPKKEQPVPEKKIFLLS